MGFIKSCVWSETESEDICRAEAKDEQSGAIVDYVEVIWLKRLLGTNDNPIIKKMNNNVNQENEQLALLELEKQLREKDLYNFFEEINPRNSK